MKVYDYFDAVKDDVREYIAENKSEYIGMSKEDMIEKLSDDLWDEDSVTGNASGSYTFNTYQAEEYLCHNWDLLNEAMEEFGCEDFNPIEKGAEWCDVTIRCYLLSQAVTEVVEEMYEKMRGIRL